MYVDSVDTPGRNCIAPYTLGDWNTVDLEFDTTIGKYRVSINGGPYTDWKNFVSPVSGGIDTLRIYASSSGFSTTVGNWDDIRLSADSDGDGFPDSVDQCPHSDLSATVVIDGCNSGVPNTRASKSDFDR